MHVEQLIAVMLRAIRAGHANAAAMVARRIYGELRALKLDVASPYWTENVGGTVLFCTDDYVP